MLCRGLCPRAAASDCRNLFNLDRVGGLTRSVWNAKRAEEGAIGCPAAGHLEVSTPRPVWSHLLCRRTRSCETVGRTDVGAASHPGGSR